MLNINLDLEKNIVVLEPDDKLTEKDFVHARNIIDEHLHLKDQTIEGIIIHSEHFPGWEDFTALIAHLKFVKDHHKQVKKVALVTDSKLSKIAEVLGSHFVAAQIKSFPHQQIADAKNWISSHAMA